MGKPGSTEFPESAPLIRLPDWGSAAPALAALDARAFTPEAEAARALYEHLHSGGYVPQAATVRAEAFVRHVRAHAPGHGFEAFQREFNLGSAEGILILCLAEALLRIPDNATADALIADKLTGGDWDRHASLASGWFAGGSGLGLEIASYIAGQSPVSSAVGKLVHRLGEPVVRFALKAAMGWMGNHFVAGGDLAQAIRHGDRARQSGAVFSFDMLGEGARSFEQAKRYLESYLGALRSLPEGGPETLLTRDGISIKLSALHPRFELRHWERLKTELLPKLTLLVREAAKRQILLTIDAEEAARLSVTLLAFDALIALPELQGYHGLGLAVQAYQKRAGLVIDWLGKRAAETGHRIPVRLVKGAYWDSEIKRAQADGLPDYPVFTRKAHTDLSYLACAAQLLASPDWFYPQFATHNALTLAHILQMGQGRDYECQRLYGMGEALYAQIGASPRCRIYAPVGEREHLLSYLIRRMLENGANTSFVHGIYDEPLEQLLADPARAAKEADFRPHPAIALPSALYGDRLNSRGYDLGNLDHLAALHQLIRLPQEKAIATPGVDDAMKQAQAAFQIAMRLACEDRAKWLEQAALAYEAQSGALLALIMDEGRKTLADAIAELREAIDYLRYYAILARRTLAPVTLPGPSGERNVLSLHPRGIVASISPWNFPLAIFTGQIAAALVAGNAVIAKPAEETPRIARFAVSLLHQAGLPEGLLQLLTGGGDVGHALVSHAATSAVAFTGSTETGFSINRALAARSVPIAPLIAETGGMNCLIVDSSALIEQAVDDIITSAFTSAGQRCSALRVVYLQREIADSLLSVLTGAMRALTPGDPKQVATDIGPVIGAEASAMLKRYISQRVAPLAVAGSAPDIVDFIVPHVYEIASIRELPGEVFGPVLHVVRYDSGSIDAVIDEINSTGYGLTFGIHSRIESRIRCITSRIRAGNVYVNRSIIGATVGSQPFGGMGLSGTGPKAGGPHYLLRFCVERTDCTNLAAIGGTIELLA